MLVQKSNESIQHKVTKDLIYSLGMIKVDNLRLCDDESLLSDYIGFEKETYIKKFNDAIIIKKGTLVFEELYTEEQLHLMSAYTGRVKPDLLGIIGEHKFAIEIVYKHDMILTHQTIEDKEEIERCKKAKEKIPDSIRQREVDRAKYKAYFDYGYNLIKIYVTDSVNDLKQGKFIGVWRLSQYAQMCRHKLWRATFPGLIKNTLDDSQVRDYNKSRGLQCNLSRYSNEDRSINTIRLSQCEKNRSDVDEKGEPKVACELFVYADGQNRIFSKSETACYHCYRPDNAINTYSSGRRRKNSTLIQFVAEDFKPISIYSEKLFDESVRKFNELGKVATLYEV